MVNVTTKDVVLKVREDVCLVNGKDPAATELIEKMRLWGEVVSLDDELARVHAKYQEIIDNITAQYQAIAAQELTSDEVILLNAYRTCKAATGEVYEKRINSLETCLEEVRVASQKKAEQIGQLLAELVTANA